MSCLYMTDADNDDASPAPRSCINNLKAILQGHEIGNGM